MTIGGKVIDSGGFGCVFRPQLRCKKSRNNKNKIYGDNKYDENGILHNWWTEKDKRKFKKIQDNVIKQYEVFASYDGIKFDAAPSIG